MSLPAAPPAPAQSVVRPLPSAWRVASLLVRSRLRSLWNGVRARGRGRFPTLVVFIGLITSLAYVGLFTQSFKIIVLSTDFAGQVSALSFVVSLVAFGSFAAKAASSEAVQAGAPENEFLLARPVSLARLVVARCLADAATDPFGALFLLPVLAAVAWVWKLPGAAWAVALLISMLTQVASSALAQALQVALSRFVPRARRRAAWMALRLMALVSLAALWMLLTWVMRAPRELALALAPLGSIAALTPGALIAGPLVAFARHAAADAALAVGLVVVAAAAMLALAAAVARRASAGGWEESGPTWTEVEAEATPGAGASPARRERLPLTAATKDLRLILRDRTQLIALVTMPVIFVGMQVFGAAGWSWSTATLRRVTYLAFSLTLYMVTIGPLTHMQAERRAFWILRAVPVPVGTLLAAKARAWSLVIGAIAVLAFVGLSLGAPFPGLGDWLESGLLVVGGAVGMTWLAVALAARAADLSDDQKPAVGPGTIYTFVLVGGLYNMVLAGEAEIRVRGIILYLLALGAYWRAGVRQATVCLDAEESRARHVSLAEGTTMAVVFTLGQRLFEAGARAAVADGAGAALAALVSRLLVMAAVGTAAVLYLARRPLGPARAGLLSSLAVAAGAGGAAGGVLRALAAVVGAGSQAGDAAAIPFPVGAGADLVKGGAILALLWLGEELIFRGVVQRGLEAELPARTSGRVAAAMAGLLVSVVAASGASEGASGGALALLVVTHTAAAGAQLATGRTSAAWLARVIALAIVLAGGALGGLR